MEKISVIVPVYKVERYMERCIDTIRNQTFPHLEIILVDDGSPDSCGEICEAYAKEDSRIQVIHKENGGLSDARNVGFSYATGEYAIFIDSDDYVELDMFEYLYHNIKEAEADVATCGVFDVYETEIKKADIKEEVIICGAEEFYRYILQGTKVRGEIWNKLFRRDLIADIKFPKGKLYEDIFFTADLVQRIKKICVGTAPKYYYVHRTSSITGRPYRRQLLDIIDGYEKTYQVVCECFPGLEQEAKCMQIWSRFIVLDKILLEKNYKEIKEYKEIARFLRNQKKEIIANAYFQKGRKLAIIILSVNINVYRQMVLYVARKQAKLKE